MHAVVIPFRGAATGKSRLTASISDTARRQIARAMFQHVLNVACTASSPRQVLVVTPSRTASAIARRCGASVLKEAKPGHNEAVAHAVQQLRRRGATTATVVAADLPFLKSSDLAFLEVYARAGNVGIAADRNGEGTNALSLSLSLSFVFQFGAESLHLHRLECRRLGVNSRVIRKDGLACDVDTPDDIHLLASPAALSTLPSVGAMACRGPSFAPDVTNAALFRQEGFVGEIDDQCPAANWGSRS